MSPYSVLMSVYIKEEAPFFRTAVESMLQQTVPPEQFVLVCDGPLTPALDEVVGWCQETAPELFTVVRLPENRGLGLALREGMLACRNELVARMDADDIALPDRMEKQLKAMERNGYPAVVGGQIAEFTQDPADITGYRQVPLTNEEIYKRGGFLCPVNHMTVLLRRSDVLAVGSYQHFPAYEDYHLWTRLLAGGYRFCNIPDICCNVRVDADFYARRGGWGYFKRTYQMEKYILENGLINRLQFSRNVVARFGVTVLVPGKLRGLVFNKFLRRHRMNTADEVKVV